MQKYDKKSQNIWNFKIFKGIYFVWEKIISVATKMAVSAQQRLVSWQGGYWIVIAMRNAGPTLLFMYVSGTLRISQIDGYVSFPSNCICFILQFLLFI